MSKVPEQDVATTPEAMDSPLPAQDGDMRKRWTAAGMLLAEEQFRRIIGYSDLAKLVTAIERHHTPPTASIPESKTAVPEVAACVV